MCNWHSGFWCYRNSATCVLHSWLSDPTNSCLGTFRLVWCNSLLMGYTWVSRLTWNHLKFGIHFVANTFGIYTSYVTLCTWGLHFKLNGSFFWEMTTVRNKLMFLFNTWLTWQCFFKLLLFGRSLIWPNKHWVLLQRFCREASSSHRWTQWACALLGSKVGTSTIIAFNK